MFLRKDKKVKSKGFTLVELLVVISIISFLSSIVLASLNTAREKARISAVNSELMELAKGLEVYKLNHGSYPPKTCSESVCYLIYKDNTFVIDGDYNLNNAFHELKEEKIYSKDIKDILLNLPKITDFNLNYSTDQEYLLAISGTPSDSFQDPIDFPGIIKCGETTTFSNFYIDVSASYAINTYFDLENSYWQKKYTKSGDNWVLKTGTYCIGN
jgi:prepilin-type N-terminal cleavage/methylation domain-containing protein